MRDEQFLPDPKPGNARGVSWGLEHRLQFIDFRLRWEGRLNRTDLTEHFGLSTPQASLDIAKYAELAPGNLSYDRSSRTYVAAEEFRPLFPRSSARRYLAELLATKTGLLEVAASFIGSAPEVDAAPSPWRAVDEHTVEAIVKAIRQKLAVTVSYQSMSSSEPTTRRLSPHALGYDGFRWHARAYCHLDNKFKDFLLPRILEVRDKDKPGLTGSSDWHWNNYFDVIIGPHPDLTESQKQVVAKDYGFDHGRGVLSVRHAMLFYVLKRLGLLGDATKLSARTQHIVALNRKETETALQAAEVQL